MAKMKAALQLYTVRTLAARDFPGTCQQVADLGYQGVELCDTRTTLSAADLRAALARMKLTACGVHVGIEALETQLDQVLEYYGQAAVTQLVCSWLPEDRRRTAADWAASAEKLSALGQRCRERGATLSYHNHAFEFDKFDGTTGLDILLKNSDPRNLKWELDTYWVQFGGGNPAEYIQRHAARISFLHVKDMAAGPERKFAPVGAGVLDWRAILAAAAKTAVRWLVVEQDNCYDTPPLEAARLSRENLRRLAHV